MSKDIVFLEGVKQTTRQKVLNFIEEWNSDSDFIEMTTSGSTGKPKLIKLAKSKMKASAKGTIDFFGLTPNQTILLSLSVDYIGGKMIVIRALENRMNIIVAPLSSNPLLTEIPYTIHFSAFVPLQLQTILSNKISKANYELINTVIIGGGVINSTLEQSIIELANSNFATFGMTETISHIALRNISKGEQHYTALPYVEFKTNTNECLIINAPLICSEINLQTTDIVHLLNTKQFIWKGRADFVINSGGIKLQPEVLEQKVESLLPNNRYYFSSEQDDLLGEKLVLKIESNVHFSTIELEQKLKEILINYEQPKAIIIVAEFKETRSGKIIRV